MEQEMSWLFDATGRKIWKNNIILADDGFTKVDDLKLDDFIRRK